jgi:hypothetical protein
MPIPESPRFFALSVFVITVFVCVVFFGGIEFALLLGLVFGVGAYLVRKLYLKVTGEDKNDYSKMSASIPGQVNTKPVKKLDQNLPDF